MTFRADVLPIFRLPGVYNLREMSSPLPKRSIASYLMSSSVRKDHFHGVSIHKIPSGHSKKEFEARLDRFLDDFICLPIVQRTVLKVEMMSQNDLLDEHVKLFGFQPQEPVVLVVVQCETVDDFITVLQNPEVEKLFDSAKEFGHQKGTSAFATDVVQKIDHPTTQHGIHSIGIYTVPAHLSLDEYGQKFHRVVENFLALPAVKKNLLKYELWLQKDVLNEHGSALGFPTPEPIFIIRAESQNLSNLIELIRVEEAQKVVGDAKADFAFNANASFFTMDIVTKMEKS
ncbi:hypothetical protein C8J57DRAFT_1281464 [Mycena rebaudengoi]|nr:hypothetical protein C8J57DRAFT_1281464 [Mycena rebaudengoi]